MAKDLQKYQINLVGLKNKLHDFVFDLDQAFFAHFEQKMFNTGICKAEISLDKRENMLETVFKISGSIELVCDRSLDIFDYVLQTEQRIFFQYGEKYEEMSEELIEIPADSETLDLSQLLYELVAVEVPMRKLHPRYKAELENEAAEDEIIFQSGNEVEKSEENVDPRWQLLKNLKISDN